MKMALLLGLVGVACAGLLSGCGARSPKSTADADAPAVPAFSAKHGLLLPEQTRQSIGLKLVEVEERKLATTLDLSFRVYRVNQGVAFGTGSVTPEQAKLLKPAQAVQVRLANGESQSARITSVNSHLPGAISLVEVLVEIPDQTGTLVPGAFVKASTTFESGEDVVAVPRAALLETSEGPMVYVVSGDHFVRTAVKAGGSDAQFVEITEGLYTGDQVVSQPVQSLWMTELAAVKGGQSCCVEPPKGK